MKKCIFSWFGYVMPFPERLKLIKESGFDATCLWWEDETYPHTIPIDDMPAMAKEQGLIIDNIHCPFQDVNGLWSQDQSVRNSVIDTYYNYIDACAKHDILHMVMHTTNEGYSCDEMSLGVNSLLRIVQRAEEQGVKIAIENTRDYHIIDFLLTEIDLKFLGLCYDSSHDWICGQSEGILLEKWKHRLLCTHLSDNNTVEDKHWIPGDGQVQWRKIMPNILSSSIDCITLELMSSKVKISDPSIYLTTAYNRLEQIMGK